MDRIRTSILEEIPARYANAVQIGAGGMGVVCRAHDSYLDKNVAIKMICLSGLDNEILARFQREAKMVSSLSHPNIVSVFDFGVTEGGKPYMVMEYLDGEPLDKVIKQGRLLSIEQALPIFLQICRGLAHAHSRNILHRDLKPSNVILTGLDVKEIPLVKILDFGLAKTQSAGDETLTKAGLVIGSPSYMSPEQALCADVDLRSDIYSMGCLMYEVLTGKPPIQEETILETIALKTREPAPQLDASLFPKEIVHIVARCLSIKPEDRFQTMEDLLSDLNDLAEETFYHREPQPAESLIMTLNVVRKQSTSKIVLFATTLVAVGVVAAFFVFRTLEAARPEKGSSSGLTKTSDKLRKQAAKETSVSPEVGVKELEELAGAADKPLDRRGISAYLFAVDSKEAEKKPQKNGAREQARSLSGVKEGDSKDQEILKLEKFARERPYSFSVFNELRHLYLGRHQEWQSMQCCDVIFQHDISNEYTLNCLGQWKRGDFNKLAMKNLLTVQKRYKSLKYLNAACLIEAGDAASDAFAFAKARECFSAVAALKDPDLAAYRQKAAQKLERL